MEVDYITGPQRERIFGMAKYQLEIRKRLPNVDYNDIEYQSLASNIRNFFPGNNSPPGKIQGENPGKFRRAIVESNIVQKLVDRTWKLISSLDRQSYRSIVKKSCKEGNIKHIPYQDLAYLLKSLQLDNTIITVHDLIPWIYYQDHSRMWRNNLAGLKEATKIITISEFSKGEILQVLDYPAEKIEVILDAVDHSRYYKKRDRRVLDALHIPPDCRVILYVGTEEPRQNFPTLLRALAGLKKRMPRVKLLKIGEPYRFGAREKNLKLIRDLKLEKEVIFLGYVEEEALPLYYNASDLLVYPCSYAGFGLPPLEVMACGTPVITSNTSSLPEVVGDAGIMIEPTNTSLLADKMWEVLSDQDLQDELSRKGLDRAKLFNWEHSARKTLKLYEEVYRGI